MYIVTGRYLGRGVQGCECSPPGMVTLNLGRQLNMYNGGMDKRFQSTIQLFQGHENT